MIDGTPIEFNYKKATQAINFFARKSSKNSISKLKVIKLIWLADRYHIRKYGRPLTGDMYFAMPFGPVGSTVKDIAELNFSLSDDEKVYATKYLSVSSNNVGSISEVDNRVLSETDIEALNFVSDNFSDKDPFELVKLSHQYPEWAKYDEGLSSKTISRHVMSYLDFFQNPTIKNDVFQIDQELLEVNKSIVEENLSLSAVLP